jgi:hypothetical protein
VTRTKHLSDKTGSDILIFYFYFYEDVENIGREREEI